MSKTKVKIPRFKSYKEEAEWWDTHDLTMIEGVEPVDEEVFGKPKQRTISIQLGRSLAEQLQQLAAQQGIDLTTLIRRWIIEKLRCAKT